MITTEAPAADRDINVAIVGAGPAGAAVALALCRAGVPGVVLIDRPPDPRPPVGESAAPQVGALLRELGLPQPLETLGHTPYHGNLSVWDSAEPIGNDFLFRGSGHGWHLDRAAFDRWLRAAAVAAGAGVIAPAILDSIVRAAGGWRIAVRSAGESSGTADTRRDLDARIVVDASGRRAAVASRLGACRCRLDRQIALVSHALPAHPEQLRGRSFIEAVADGWWYAASLPDGRAVVMCMTDDDIGRERCLIAPEQFRRAWAATHHLRELVPPPATQIEVHAFSCATQYLDRVAGPGWIAVGDAMIGFDPLTSSGIAGALDDALAAAEVILQWAAGDGAAARQAAADYVRRAEVTLRRYLAERGDRYRAGNRWPEQPFWQRRAG